MTLGQKYFSVGIFVLQSLVSFNYSAGIALYAGLSLLATVAALLLPIETKGKSLMVCNHSFENNIDSYNYYSAGLKFFLSVLEVEL